MLFTAALVALSLMSAESLAQDEFRIVYGFSSLIHKPDTSSILPWEADKYKPKEKNEIVIPPGGVIYDIAYYEYRPGAYRFKPSNRVRIRFNAPYGDMTGDYLFVHPTLIKIRRWKGINYLLGYARLQMDTKGDLFVASPDLPEDWDLIELFVKLTPDKSNDFCEPIEFACRGKFDCLERPFIIKKDDHTICYTHLLPVEKLKITRSKN